ncbi:hypothetical protein IV203_038733 [Nitzschia inconspicua]|uniref:Uncharacterized protein n=1 Tax=Nitzschia inconspicua TaxID=303405 RepID=A0A9K3LPG9_9STRA|nr:hypothetical protein IV203_038733 [Nitzschia inconspicua]
MTEEAGDGGSGSTVSAPSTKIAKRNDDRREHRDRDTDDSSFSNNRTRSKDAKETSRFEGSVPELNTHVYVLGGKMDTFHQTTAAIGEYMERTIQGAGGFRQAFVQLSFEPLEEPDKTKGDHEAERWKMEFKMYLEERQARKKLQQQAFFLACLSSKYILNSIFHRSASWSPFVLSGSSGSSRGSKLSCTKACLVKTPTSRVCTLRRQARIGSKVY